MLAAGSGRRMGGPKAELVVDGQRLLDRALLTLTDGGCEPVLAVVRPETRPPGEPGTPVRLVVNTDAARGQRSSLAVAVAAAAAAGPDIDALAVLLVDLPGVGAPAVRKTIQGWRPERITVASYRGRRGHPVVMGLADWERALVLAGPDEGARALLAEAADRVDEIEVDGDPLDLDIPADVARWHAAQT